MVKEIETKNTTEILEDNLQVSEFETVPEIVTASLSSNGTTMSVKINRHLRSGSAPCVRKVSLYYMLPAFEQQMVAEYELGTYGPSADYDYDYEYSFSLEKVLTQIVHTAPEQLADDTITVRLFTYEANITTDYGLKTLHVPYTVSYPGSMITPVSTDGWYRIKVIDAEIFRDNFQYSVGDIVCYNDGYYICIIRPTIGTLPTNATYWEVMSTEQEFNLYEFGKEQSSSIATILCTDMLITRWIKQKYIYELLVKSNYKRYDDIFVVAELEKLFSMREAAVVHLKAGNPIYARYLLEMIQIEVNSFMANNGERRVVETITNFTI